MQRLLQAIVAEQAVDAQLDTQLRLAMTLRTDDLLRTVEMTLQTRLAEAVETCEHFRLAETLQTQGTAHDLQAGKQRVGRDWEQASHLFPDRRRCRRHAE